LRVKIAFISQVILELWDKNRYYESRVEIWQRVGGGKSSDERLKRRNTPNPAGKSSKSQDTTRTSSRTTAIWIQRNVRRQEKIDKQEAAKTGSK